MSIQDHPDYEAECQRLQFTRHYMEAVIQTAKTSTSQFQENIQAAFEDVDWLESSLGYNQILMNARFFEVSKSDVEKLEALHPKPYFARIDFLRDGQDNTEVYYIGKTSLYQHEDQEPIIVDWRSQISNLYYEGRIGRESYKAEGGTYHGELSTKRQYTIEEGALQDIRDIDLTTTDELLQDSLAKSASNRLSDIVSTIQEEQNEIIRADLNKPIIVQGAAGSGKTTIALHRISYFIYQYAEHFRPEELMILAPSRLFIDYISEVLPELGVDRVRQTTFADFVQSCLTQKIKLAPDKKLINLVEQPTEEVKEAAFVAHIKGSPQFEQVLRGYLRSIEKTFYPRKDFQVDKYKLYGKQKLARLMKEDFVYLPYQKRVIKVKGILQADLRRKRPVMRKQLKDFFENKIERGLYGIKNDAKRKAYVSEALDRQAERTKQLEAALRTGVSSYMQQFPKKKLLTYYKELFHDPDAWQQYAQGVVDEQTAQRVCTYTERMLKKGLYEQEDLAALLWLQTDIFGVDRELKSRNVVIDEAQDYSYLQFASLKRALETDMFTVVGDLAQGIHSYRGLTDWQVLIEKLFPRAQYRELQKSYRTTIEVMNEANRLLPLMVEETPAVEPVVRHGDVPIVITGMDEYSFVREFEQQYAKDKGDGLLTSAIIVKTMRDANRLRKAFEQQAVDIQLLEEQAAYDTTKPVIVPSYLSKGLEFDVVTVVSLDEVYKKEQPLDVKLLYVAMTRPLHRLRMYAKAEGAFAGDLFQHLDPL
ncbi:HelD family protein [Bacillus fonticola]|uniref:HelD family protein n=1 Tax=Bacillus fonticola TaxID=2728853 RepID=UPI00147409CF|nr:UvrD-helicase domain-containing protein [Bacillus fonticola]